MLVIEEKFNIQIDDNTKELYIKKFVGILNNKKQINCIKKLSKLKELQLNLGNIFKIPLH